METISTSQDRAKSYAERSKLKRKVLQMLKDKEEYDAIIAEIVSANYTEKSAKKLWLEVRIERNEDRIKKIWTGIVVCGVIAIAASFLLSNWSDDSKGSRGYNYFLAMVILPFILLVVQGMAYMELKGMRQELRELDEEK